MYNKAAGKEDDNLKINIGLVYENEEEINDLDKVNYWYQKSAESDNKVALYKLGELHEIGKGIEEYVLMMFEFYKKSAEKGYVDGKYKLGYCYDHGIGADVDKEKAFNLYKLAAEEGNNEAQISLAILYEQGEGTKQKHS